MLTSLDKPPIRCILSNENLIFAPPTSLLFAEHDDYFIFAIGPSVVEVRSPERTCVANTDDEKRIIESFPYNMSVYYIL